MNTTDRLNAVARILGKAYEAVMNGEADEEDLVGFVSEAYALASGDDASFGEHHA
jgi:hypothetical protein